MGLFDAVVEASLFPRRGQQQARSSRPLAAPSIYEPGTLTFTHRVPISGGGENYFERQWAAIIRNEGGTGPRGEFRRSPKGAMGPAQVMPDTAREAARLANLPWDERRYRTDADYNIRLGRAYYIQQLREFRDPAMAAAAYNGGPNRLRRAREAARRYGGSWESYLPPETRNYVRNFRANLSAEQSDQGSVSAD